MFKNIFKDIIKPRRVEVDSNTGAYGKYIISPLERGYGTTLGNSLRRVLLSSLSGAAITSIKIDGVSHEFSSIPGVLEDVTEIILNLKEVILSIQDKDQVTLRLEASGNCIVTAGMISGDPACKIINPEKHIATITEGGSIKMEITAKVGRGYVTAEELSKEEQAVGSINIDAIFSPVKKVNFIVTNARVGQRTDYDRLALEIWTDGSVIPEEALTSSAAILADQLSVFSDIKNIVVEPEIQVIETMSTERPRFNDNLFRRIDELELSVRSSNCLENANIKYIGELVMRSEAEMLRTKNFGRKSLNEIKELLSEMGLHLGMRLDGFPQRTELDKMAEQSGTVVND